MSQKASALLLSATMALVLSSCGNPAANTGSEQSPSPSVEAASASLPIAVGEAGEAGGIAFTVTDVTKPKQIGSVGVGPKAEAGETFLVVTYKLKNTSDRPLPPSKRPTVTLIDPRGQSYVPDEMASGLAAVHMDGTGSFSADLNPNVSAKDCAAWKLDVSALARGTWRLVVATNPQLTFALK